MQIKPTELLQADLMLKQALKDNIIIGDKPIVVYAQGERPTSGYPADFVEILHNGSPTALTESMELTTGNLAIAVYTKSNNGVSNLTRLRLIMEKVEDRAHNVFSGIFYYKYNFRNITSPSSSLLTGYSGQVVNVTWKILDMALAKQELLKAIEPAEVEIPIVKKYSRTTNTSASNEIEPEQKISGSYNTK